MPDVLGPGLSNPLPRIGQCIYCGAREYDLGRPQAKLGDEHIIPEGLGGRLILRDASCRACEVTINGYESQLISALISHNRRDLGLFGRKAAPRARMTPKERPTMLYMLMYEPAGILRGRPPEETSDSKLVGSMLANFRARFIEQGKRTSVKFGHGLSDIGFRQTLAKIAHAYGVAALGLNQFKPLLINLIRNKAPLTPYFLVGGDPNPRPRTMERHTINHAWQCVPDGREILVVSIRLFGNLGMPGYMVATGERLS